MSKIYTHQGLGMTATLVNNPELLHESAQLNLVDTEPVYMVVSSHNPTQIVSYYNESLLQNNGFVAEETCDKEFFVESFAIGDMIFERITDDCEDTQGYLLVEPVDSLVTHLLVHNFHAAIRSEEHPVKILSVVLDEELVSIGDMVTVEPEDGQSDAHSGPVTGFDVDENGRLHTILGTVEETNELENVLMMTQDGHKLLEGDDCYKVQSIRTKDARPGRLVYVAKLTQASLDKDGDNVMYIKDPAIAYEASLNLKRVLSVSDVFYALNSCGQDMDRFKEILTMHAATRPL